MAESLIWVYPPLAVKSEMNPFKTELENWLHTHGSLLCVPGPPVSNKTLTDHRRDQYES